MPLAYNVRAFQSAPLTAELDARAATETLARLGAGMRNPAPVVNGLAGAMRQHVRTQFAVGGNPAWVPNKLNTVAAKGHSKPLHGGRGKSGIEQSTRITVSEVGRELSITIHTSAIGRFHQEGRKGPWTIAPHGNYPLRFQVAGVTVGGRTLTGREGLAAFRARRSRALARRRATGRGQIPGRPGAVTVYALSVQHPGYPARPFLPPVNPNTPAGDAFLQQHWRTPLRAYLFGSRP
jgi:hypothetical protein